MYLCRKVTRCARFPGASTLSHVIEFGVCVCVCVCMPNYISKYIRSHSLGGVPCYVRIPFNITVRAHTADDQSAEIIN